VDEIVSQKNHRQERERSGISHAHYITAPSVEVLKAVKNHYHLSLTASQVIANPIKATIEEETWNIDTCRRDSLLFVGRFDRLKGGDYVLRVFDELAASNSRLKLTFVGPDRGIIQTDGKIFTFEQFVRSNFPERLRSRIEFLGQMGHSDVMSLRLKHFATIIASQYETAGYSVLEGMSLGCPMVATAVGGIPELIQHERNGLLVPSQNVKLMVAACKRLLEDHSLAARLGRQAWKDCRNFYDPENIAKQTVATYENAIEQFKAHNGHSHPNP
jgi:glycosyltransferase involved in cell wall biosynthesis